MTTHWKALATQAWGIETKSKSSFSNFSFLWATKQWAFAPNVPLPPNAQHLNWVLPSGSVGTVKHTDSNPLWLSLSTIFFSGLHFPRIGSRPSEPDSHGAWRLWPSSGSFVLDVHPIIKHSPYCLKVYSETFLQTPVHPSRTVVCFHSDENQPKNAVWARPMMLNHWPTPTPTLMIFISML